MPTRLTLQLRLRAALARVATLTVASMAASPAAVLALGTAAGTNIASTTTVDYSVGSTAATATSNTATIAVAEIVDVTVALQSSTKSVTAGGSNEALLFLVANTGNSVETFSLAGDSVLVGDDFDPAPAAPFIYFDTDGSADLSPGDTPYVAGSNDPVLAADASVAILLVNDIPAGVPDGDRGRSELRATAATGSGAPGTVYPGQGSGGVDAVTGTSGGEAAVFGEYLVGAVQLSAVKSQTVLDPFGGAEPVPGAAIRYEIVVTATGSGTAVGALLTDAIPANTTYVAGSLALNGTPLTDAADADSGSFATAPSARVAVSLGDLTAAGGPQTVVFRVTID